MPGGQVTLSLTFEDDGAPLDTTLTLRSDDPDRPTHDIPVTMGACSNPLAVGMPAPDFVLPGLDGQTHRPDSSEARAALLLRHLVTHLPVEVSDIDHTLLPAHRERGATLGHRRRRSPTPPGGLS